MESSPNDAAITRGKVEQQLRHYHGIIQGITQGPPLVLWSCDRNGIFLLSEGAGLKGLGLLPGQVVGLNVYELYAAFPDIIAAVHQALEGESASIITTTGNVSWDSHILPLRDEEGTVIGVIGLAWDISERLSTQKDLEQKLSLIQRQESMIRTLSTTIMRVWKHVLALPLVGAIDTTRAEQILATLLQAVVDEQAQYVIIDMTGIGEVDSSTAEHLFRVMRAVGLLGANAIVTGTRPAVATALVELGVDLSSVVTLRDLEEGLQFVMARQAGKRPRARP